MRHKILFFAILLMAAVSCKQSGSSYIRGSGDGSLITVTDDGTATATATAPAQAKAGDKVSIEQDWTGVKFLSRGNIIPSSGNLNLLFTANGYAKAQVRIRKVFTNNILQYLQLGSSPDTYSMSDVSKTIADTTLSLAGIEDTKASAGTYAINLSKIIRPEPGAIYRVEIRGREPYSESTEDCYDSDYSFGDWRTIDERRVDLLASDITLIVKRGDSATDVFVYDIITGKPVSGARVKLFDYVQQELAKGSTDKDGKVRFSKAQEATFITASSGSSSAYLRLSNEKSLSVSDFDAGGKECENGLKAYIFGDRGVWRPGDTLHIAAIACFEGTALPAGHPITAELCNPDGQTVQTISVKNDGTNLWHFPFVTATDAPTGYWTVVLKIGTQNFRKLVRIETVKPNKLDIGLEFNRDILTPDADCKGTAAVRWLYGAVGSNLKLTAEMELSSTSTTFKGYDKYSFTDKARCFDNQTINLGSFTTDANGKCSFNTATKLTRANIPGMLKASFTLNAFEPSGEFSTCSYNFKLSPFQRYLGISTQMDKSEWGEEYLRPGSSHTFEIAALSSDGNPVAANSIKAQIWRVDWSWWWSSSSQLAHYSDGNSKSLIYETDLNATNGKASFDYTFDEADSGLYYIKVYDGNYGHSASLLCEVYDYAPSGKGSDGFAKLLTGTNKDSYNVGETALLTFPSSAGSTALISIEKGGRVLSTTRIDCAEGCTRVQIPVNGDMVPNAYAVVTLIQPHSRTLNDAPIRMYGISNISVQDASTHLHPIIDIPAETEPESTLKFKVREKDGRAMSYVVAIVDEGLLSLTGFKTPDAWNSFYAKEALRVRTWDRYDDIIGAYGGHIEQMFAIGGDYEGLGKIKPKGANRFKPVVAWLGPFTLKGGRTAQHSISIPQYIGSLRAMVVATSGKAQGSTASNVTVTKPLMVQATLPRTLAVQERIKVPATVFTQKAGIGNVKLGITADGPLSVVGPASKSINVQEATQSVEYFELQVGDNTGIGHVKLTAQGGGVKSESAVEIDVLAPNPDVTRVQNVIIESGQSINASAQLFGLEAGRSAQVEFSVMPPVDLRGRLRYLTAYPFGCLEQTVSAAFPQLFIATVMDCDKAFTDRCERNVKAALNRLQSFRTPDGALSYWPGNPYSSLFTSAYALHFMQQAQASGYAVSENLRKSLSDCLSSAVAGKKDMNVMAKAYALYVLAEGGRPQRAAMNTLREKVAEMPNGAVWALAAAYAVDGKKEIAAKLTEGLPYTESDSNCYSYCFGSEDRNLAFALKTAILCGNQQKALDLASKLSVKMSDSSHYMSTQSTAWALLAVSDFAAKYASKGINAAVDTGGKKLKLQSSKTVSALALPLDKAVDGALPLCLTNNGNGLLHASIQVSASPESGSEVAKASVLKASVSYVDDSGSPISVDTLSRGRTFKAKVTLVNSGSERVKNIAISQRFPSGWEIKNDRLFGSGSTEDGVDYRDIRDDRVYTFVSLAAGSSITVVTGLTATYPGRFYLPAITCEAMYDASKSAVVPGKWVEVK